MLGIISIQGLSINSFSSSFSLIIASTVVLYFLAISQTDSFSSQKYTVKVQGDMMLVFVSSG